MRKRNSVKGDAMSSMKRVKYDERKSNARWTPKRNDARCQRGQQIRCKMLVGSVRCPLWRNSPLPLEPSLSLAFRSLPVMTPFFSYLQQLIMVNTLCPSVHLHLSFTCWLVSSSSSYVFYPSGSMPVAGALWLYTISHVSRMRTHPPVWLSLTLRVVHSFSWLFHDQTNQKEEGYLEIMRNNEKGMRSFVFFFTKRTPTPFSMKLAQGGNGYFWNGAFFRCYCCLLIDSHLVPPVSVPKDASNENQWKIWDCKCCNKTVKNQWPFRGLAKNQHFMRITRWIPIHDTQRHLLLTNTITEKVLKTI